MPYVASFYSMLDEAAKTRMNRVFHNNSDCPGAKSVAERDRLPSTGGHRICPDCEKLNAQEAAKRR